MAAIDVDIDIETDRVESFIDDIIDVSFLRLLKILRFRLRVLSDRSECYEGIETSDTTLTTGALY